MAKLQEYTFEHQVSADRDELYWFFADIFKAHCKLFNLPAPTKLEEWFSLDEVMSRTQRSGAMIRMHNRYQRLMAAALLYPRDTDDSQSTIVLKVIGVDADYQHQGVGRQLIDQVMQEAFTLGGRKIKVVVPTLFRQNVGFFETMGFEKDAKSPEVLSIAIRS